VAVGIPEGSKYSCSPLAIATNLEITRQNFSMPQTDKGFYWVPAKAYKRVLSADHPWSNICLAARGKAPPARTESLVENAAVLDFGKVYQAVCCGILELNSGTGVSARGRTWLDLNIDRVHRSQKDLRNLLVEG